MSVPLSPAPVRSRRPGAIPAYIANGVIGLRCGWIPFRDGVATVNGFAGLGVEDGVEGFARAPFPLGADIMLEGVRLSRAVDQVRLVEQRYDFSRAELTTILEYRIREATARIEVVQFCSHKLPTIALQELRVTVDRAADLSISVGLDPSEVDGHGEILDRPVGKPGKDDPDGLQVWHANGDSTSCGMAYRAEILGAPDATRVIARSDERRMLSTSWSFRARADRPYRVRHMTSLVPSLAHPHPADQAARLLSRAWDRGWDGMREDQAREWERLWRSRIVIDGADRRWQAITDASLFYLLTSVHPASVASTSLFGLADWPNYHYYRGHVMWDIETFALPPLLLTEPEAARSILDFRFRHLDAARLNARLSGWNGALYPWEACPIHGEEVTPAASAQNKGHAGLDVALAFALFVHATGDSDYLRRHAWPVVAEVAKYVESRAERTPRGFEIRGETGPAEADPPRNNNAYTNMAAAQVVREALGFAEQLGERPRPLWSALAEGIVLPATSRGRHIPNYDDYRIDHPKAGTPEAAAGIFPVGYRVSPEVEQATFRYAVDRQAPSYLGTPMLSAFVPYYAARLGRREQAAQLLEPSYGTFINQPWLETDEFPREQPDKPQTGPMFANIGGYLTTLLYGYPGLRLGPGKPETWAERPVVLPAGWKAIHVERIWAHGEERSLTAVDGAPAAIIDGRSLRRVS